MIAEFIETKNMSTKNTNENHLSKLSNPDGTMTDFVKERLKLLTPKERIYFRVMWAKYGVLFIQSKPGVAKSAIMRNIAFVMGYHYIDMRLSMSDESDFKYPYLEDKEYDGKMYKVSGTAVPSWAFEANTRPTLIHFEELNRSQLFVRNAALQIMLEREIGEFKFNDNVIMVASGNLGDEDGTDVEELDSALNNRLIHLHHSLSHNEWDENFGSKEVHPLIASFLRAYPDRLYQDPTNNTAAYATPRSWTILSKYITSNYGKNANPSEFIGDVRVIGNGCVGNVIVRFLQYCEDMMNISINDVLNNYPGIKNDLEKYNRDKKSELIQSLKEINIETLTNKQINNVYLFLKTVGDDQLTGYLLGIIDDPKIDITNKTVESFITKFRDILLDIKRISEI